MTRLHRPTPAAGGNEAARSEAHRQADSHDAELAARAELGSLRPRRSGFESFGFVVGADGSATGGSASAALAAIGVVSGQLRPASIPELVVVDEATIIDLTAPQAAARPAPTVRSARTPRTAQQA